MLFPRLSGQRSTPINLNHEAEKWLSEQKPHTTNPLLDPNTCQTFITACHQRLNVDFSYGGWMEDRNVLWNGSYLDLTQSYLHLGVDFNVPSGTEIALNTPATVLRIDDDYPDQHGWGTRIFVQENNSTAITLFAHLDQKLAVRVGEKIPTGGVLATVGLPPYNGNWFPHLHVQRIEVNHFKQLLRSDLRDLDGYGKKADLEQLKHLFPNPLPFITL